MSKSTWSFCQPFGLVKNLNSALLSDRWSIRRRDSAESYVHATNSEPTIRNYDFFHFLIYQNTTRSNNTTKRLSDFWNFNMLFLGTIEIHSCYCFQSLFLYFQPHLHFKKLVIIQVLHKLSIMEVVFSVVYIPCF